MAVYPTERNTVDQVRSRRLTRWLGGLALVIALAVFAAAPRIASFLADGEDHQRPKVPGVGVVTFTLSFADFTVYENPRGQVTGVAIEVKDPSRKHISANFVRPGDDQFSQDYACSAKDSPCVFKRPADWTQLIAGYEPKASVLLNPARSTFTSGLQCTEATTCTTLVQRATYTVRLHLTTDGRLTGMQVLESTGNLELKIMLQNNEDINCSLTECRWDKERTVVKAKDSWFGFKPALDWMNMGGPATFTMEHDSITRNQIILLSERSALKQVLSQD